MSPGVSKAIFSLLAVAVILIVDSDPISAQSGCAVLNKDQPAQSLSFEGVEGTTNQPNAHVVVRFRNNSTCDVTLLIHDNIPAPARPMVFVRRPDGKLLIRIDDTDDFPDGARLDLLYSIDYQQPLPPPKKRIFVDYMLTEFRLRPGKSTRFTVPLEQFDLWIVIKVPFRFDWEPDFYRPAHHAYFGNLDLPDEVFRKTKICPKFDGCKP